MKNKKYYKAALIRRNYNILILINLRIYNIFRLARVPEAKYAHGSHRLFPVEFTKPSKLVAR